MHYESSPQHRGLDVLHLVVHPLHSCSHNRVGIVVAMPSVPLMFPHPRKILLLQSQQAPPPEHPSNRVEPLSLAPSEPHRITGHMLHLLVVFPRRVIHLRVEVQLLQTKTQPRQPKEQISILRAVQVKRPFLENQREAFPRLQFAVAFLSHRIRDLAIDDAFDIR